MDAGRIREEMLAVKLGLADRFHEREGIDGQIEKATATLAQLQGERTHAESRIAAQIGALEWLGRLLKEAEEAEAAAPEAPAKLSEAAKRKGNR